jgi:hypothetical protein
MELLFVVLIVTGLVLALLGADLEPLITVMIILSLVGIMYAMFGADTGLVNECQYTTCYHE